MPIIIAEGVVQVTGDGTKVTSQVARDIDADGEQMTQTGTGMGKRLLGGLIAAGAVAGVTNWLSGAILGASDLNETVSKSDAIFGSSASAIDKWGDRAAVNLGLSKSNAQAAAAGFGDMFSQIGFAGDEVADMSMAVVQASADLGSFNNLDTADVADRMSAAFRGEYDSLQAVIPNINAARVESEALAATGKTVASELTAQEKAAAVLAIVQKDGARAMGDFAKTSDGFANQTKISTAQLDDMQASVGTALLPTMQGFMSFLLTDVIPAFKGVANWVSENIDFLGKLVVVLGIAGGAYLAITTAGKIYTAFQVASAAASGGLTVAQWALNAAMSANPIGLIVVAIAALVAGIVWVATETTFFQDVWAGMVDIIAGAWNWLWTTVLEPVFTAIGDIFTWLWDYIIHPIITGIMTYIGLWAALFTWLWENVLSPVFAAIGDIFTWIWESIISPIVDYIVLAIGVWGEIFTWLNENIITPIFAAIGDTFTWLWENIISPVSDFISGAITTVGDTINDVFGGISDFIGSAFESVLGVVKGPINALIGLINGVIGGLNSISVKIPDWVPDVGGQTFGLSIPKIPLLARGTNNAPDAFIAGEAGPELITGAQGATVRPYSVTQDLLARGGSGPSVSIGSVIIDAKNIKEFTDVVEAVKALPQVARTGRVRLGV